MRARIRDELAMRPRTCALAARLASVIHARHAAAMLRQLSSDMVTVAAPTAAVDGRNVVVRLPGRVGRDQVATALRDGGWNGFEPPMPTVFAACTATYPGVVYDVGANTGFYAAVATAAHKENTVVAFEPFPPVRADLMSTLRVNRCGDRVRVESCAVSSHVGEATLHVPLQDHGLVETSASLSSEFKEAYSELLPVEVLTLDAFSSERHPGRATVMKIDVESLEAEVLKGAVGMLRTHRPLVFYELLPNGDPAAIERIRRDVRYTDVRLHATTAEVGRAVSFDPEGWNHLLVPNEKLDAVVALIERCGLAVSA